MARKKRTSPKKQEAKVVTTAKSREPKTTTKKQPVAAASTMKATRQSFTPAQRAKILAAATANGLTGKQVAKRYGISMVTYYLWRKKAGATERRTRVAKGDATPKHDLTAQLRLEVQAKIRELLPGILRAEVAEFLKAAFK